MGIKKALYEEKRSYVDQLNPGLSVKGLSVRYARDVVSGKEYILVRDAVDTPFFLEVTGDSHAVILDKLCTFTIGIMPNSLVTDPAHKKSSI